MRKKIFLITAFLCIAAVADAQLNTLFEQENPAGFSDVTNVVYANIQGRHYAIYHVRGSGNGERIRIVEFTQYYSGAPLSPWSYVATWDYQVAQDYWISDLAVFGNYLFFCGKKISWRYTIYPAYLHHHVGLGRLKPDGSYEQRKL